MIARPDPDDDDDDVQDAEPWLPDLTAFLDASVPSSALPIKSRRTRSFRACYACVNVGGRPLTAAEDKALRIIAGALLEARAWIGSTNAWLTADGNLLERLEFRTLPPKPSERLTFVEVTASADKRGRKRAARARADGRTDP